MYDPLHSKVLQFVFRRFFGAAESDYKSIRIEIFDSRNFPETKTGRKIL